MSDAHEPEAITTSEDFELDLDGDGVVDGAGHLERTIVDLDGDGLPDAIIQTETVLLDLDDDGRLETIRVTETVAIDADGDGTVDIIGGVEVTAADLDGDGTIDVVTERHIGPDDPRGPLSGNIVVEDDAGVRTVTWNRPDALNAMSIELWDGTRDALQSAGSDVRCIVLTGTGRAFTVGQDLSEMADPRQREEGRGFRGLMDALQAVEVPMIAAVNGMAVGFGTTLLPWCDIAIAASSARFRVPFVPLGVTTEAGSSATLPAVMGPQVAARFVLTGAWMSAADALASGLVSEVLPDAELLGAAQELASQLAAQPPDSLRTTTKLLRAGRTEAWQQAIEREYRDFARLAGGPENRAAIEAFFSRS